MNTILSLQTLTEKHGLEYKQDLTIIEYNSTENSLGITKIGSL
jgi:hypothetical protein